MGQTKNKKKSGNARTRTTETRTVSVDGGEVTTDEGGRRKKQPTKKSANRAAHQPVQKALTPTTPMNPPPPTAEQLQQAENYRQTQPEALAYVGDFLNRTLMRDKPVAALINDFRAQKRGNDLTKMTAFVANHDKNRYKDVGCLDNNRVILRLGAQPYIHANYVGPKEDPKKFICCQAPLDSTIADFWTMVAQEGCRCIVMLCNYTEKNLPKCAHYLPAQLNAPQTYGQVTVTSLRSDRFAFQQSTKTVVVRTFLEVTLPSGPTTPAQSQMGSTSSAVASTITAQPLKRFQVEHLHWLDWPDRGVPPADHAPIELIQHVQQFAGSPIIVHCSAGIGRTGCFVLMDILLDQFTRGLSWSADLMAMVIEIRQSRNNSIQTEQQYLYCHQVMLNFLEKQGILSQDMVKAHFPWTAVYNSQCEAFN